MAEQTTPFRDSTLNLDQAYYYILLLLIEADTFSYAVVFKKKLLAYGANNPISELAEPGELQELLGAPYKKVIAGFGANGFALFTHDVFNVDQAANFARILDVKPNEKVLGQILDDQNYVIYKVDETELASIEHFNFKDITLAAKGLVKLIAENNPADTNLYINLTGDKIEFIYFRSGMLRFYNKFQFKSDEDAVYYIALVMNELRLDTSSTTLLLSGSVNINDSLYNHLNEFFPNVAINQIKLLETPAQVMPHNILPLASLLLCESSEVF